MKFLFSALPALATGFLALTFSSCTTQYGRMQTGGVPGWMQDGAVLEDEPEPRRPDPTDIPNERLGGPLEFSFKEKIETSEQARKRKKAVDDLFGR